MSSPVTRLFDRVANVYDSAPLQRLVYRPAQDLAIKELRAYGATRVLDVGCGTGLFAARMRAELDAELVCGCDLSPGMLAHATARSARVEWILGDSGCLPLADGVVDAVVCTEAFHWFDQPRAVAEFHRVLSDGGVLLVAMINPRTEVGSRLLRAQARKTARWPTRSDMRRLTENAGFTVRRQHRVNRILGRTLPTVLTVAERTD
ncbi:MAG TPA: methyltransferase domain-containing protein [Actinomycetota bacterium]|nr:methyltransferase domain-containing protein [Actinomycetota bacterium]